MSASEGPGDDRRLEDDVRYPCRTVVAVQWGDVDRMQHVNNVVYYRWLETARTRYFEEIEFERHVPEGVYPILATLRCDFRAQLRYPDAISVEVGTSTIGRSSSTQIYRVLSTKGSPGTIVAEAEGTWVCFDYRAQRAVPLPDALVKAMEAYEGRALPRASRTG
jgi:acyl-CoA thioester hydrolase